MLAGRVHKANLITFLKSPKQDVAVNVTPNEHSTRLQRCWLHISHTTRLTLIILKVFPPRTNTCARVSERSSAKPNRDRC